MGASMEIDKAWEWYRENLGRFDYWLRNVVIVPDEVARESGAIFQEFVQPVPSTSPLTFLQSQELLYHSLMKHVILGKPSKGIKHPNGRDWQSPPMFSGFLDRVGRLPREGDHALFTATRWFHYSLISRASIHTKGINTGQSYPALVINCSVDFFEKADVNQA